ncbi:amidohydrolase family protein [Winogradskyella sp.]|uniref:amidohydrolase family protein n=1 Tax=Winogradskyella sp. TaxID=1883156 RepID=UPI003BAD7AC6
MKHILLATLIGLMVLSCDPSGYDLALANVHIFDTKTKSVLRNKTVLINADTIAAIIDVEQTFRASRTIEGNERLLTPSFIDTHVHLIGNYGTSSGTPEDYAADNGLKMLRDMTRYHYLNHGVTTVIEMGQPEEWIDVTLGWQNNPKPDYPNVYICGGSIVSDDDRRQPAHHIEVKNPEDGRQKVRDYAKRGLKYMKFYSKLRKPDYKAMAEEAKLQGIIVNTHVDNNVMTIGEAMDLGVKNFEHIFTLTPSILNYDIHWKQMNADYGIRMSGSIDEFAAQMVFFFGYIKAHPELEAKLMTLFDRMAREGATLSTALNVVAASAGQSDFFSSFEYYPIRTMPMVRYNETQLKIRDEAYNTMMEYLKIAYDKGVKLRIGTDCRNGGRAFLSELQLLVNSGQFSMAEALEIATINGYEAMQLDEDYGTIEVGKKADLLLFDANPFEDASNVLASKTVIKDGVVLDRKKSIAFLLQDIIAEDGMDAGRQFFNAAKTNKTEFKPLDIAGLRHVIKQLARGDKIQEAMEVYQWFKTAFPDKTVDYDSVDLTNMAYGLVRRGDIPLLKGFMNFWNTNYPKEAQYVGLNVFLTMEDQGIMAAELQFKAIKDRDDFILDEGEMNGLGYLYLSSLGEVEKALAIFKMNVEAFPESSNVYDSLGEAYLEAGDKVLAKKNYEKSLELDPDNRNAKGVLENL